ncbi:MAG: hypothetical protein WC518_01740 [Patescibacteria group bacterium]
MLLYLFLFLFLFLTIFALLMSFSLIVGLIQTGGVPFVSTSRRGFDAISQLAEIKPGDIIYDLGCGKAHFLIQTVKKHNARGIGYELALWPYLWAKFNVWRSRARVKIYRKNFFKASLNEADVVFCYLFPGTMVKLEPKFSVELRPNARVVVAAFQLPNLEPKKSVLINDNNTKLGKFYLYVF